jgi:hypothetical protein
MFVLPARTLPFFRKLSIQLRDDIHALVDDVVTGKGDGLDCERILMFRNHYP